MHLRFCLVTTPMYLSVYCTEPSYQNQDTLIEQSTLIQQSNKTCNEPMLKSLSDSISECLVFKTFFFGGGGGEDASRPH